MSTFLEPVARLLGFLKPVGLPPDRKSVERELRDLLQSGWCLEAAIHYLHHVKGYEYLFLWPVVASVSGLSEKDAIRLVVTSCDRETPTQMSEHIRSVPRG